MKKKEIQAEVDRRLALGDSKTSVFKALSGQGVRDSVLANMVASYPEPARIEEHRTAIQVIRLIAWLQLVLATLFTFVTMAKSGWTAALVVTALIGGFCYLFVWGFKHNKAWAYNATIFLTVINLPRHFDGFSQAPVAGSVGLAITASVVAFTCYLRFKLFPDFAFITPVKVRGEYKFSS